MKWLTVILLIRTVLSASVNPGSILNDQSEQDPGILENIEQALGAPCPEGWMGFKSYCYFASSSSKTWDQARAHCEGLEGELVKINSAEENAFVLALVREVIPSKEQFWIGLKWNSAAKDFLWSDNSVPSYKNWAPNEPNGKASEPCGCMWTRGRTYLPFQASGYWNDRPCGVLSDYPCGFVCKRLP